MEIKPEISVIMPVYNGERYLRDAVESILKQTYRNFEFIIIDDGSKDESLEIINECKKLDSRIVVVSRENKGLIYSLNQGIEIASGKYIARMDCDDISMPERFEKQINFLKNNIEYGLVGTWYVQIDENDVELQKCYLPKRDEEIKAFFAIKSVLGHGSIMARKELLYNNKYGVGNYNLIEDFELWIRLSYQTKIANIGEFLYRYRWYDGNFSSQKFSGMMKEVSKLTEDYWNNNFLTIKYYLDFLFEIEYNKTRSNEEKKFISNYSYGFVKRAILSRKYILAIKIYAKLLNTDKFKIIKLLRIIQVFVISLFPKKLSDKYNLRRLFNYK